MDVAQRAELLKQAWAEHTRHVARPRACRSCDGERVWWDGWDSRTASVRLCDQVVHVVEIRIRRVQCAACRFRWRLSPPGIVARKHYQPDVVAHAASAYLFEAGVTQEQVAAAVGCSRRTIGRWVRWLAALASPAALLTALARLTDSPFVPSLPSVESLRTALHQRAAQALTLFEALGSALGAEPPGLRAVLERLGGAPAYAAPALPDPLPDLAR